ncbi:MAG TPA: DUF998 domain-containing protein [Microbacteriaceae bacterium]|nr:DUF998 domain-containing protein [Microbacteriaceae bacterium]
MQPGYLVRRGLARAALGGIALYVVIDVALVFLRPEFSVLHNAESDYGSAGGWAWLMDVNFVLRCLASLAAVGGLALAVPTGDTSSDITGGRATGRNAKHAGGRDTDERVAGRRGGRLRVALALLVVWALASGLLALFPDDPAGTPLRATGRVHLALASTAFLAALIGTILATAVLSRQPEWQGRRVSLLALSWGSIVPLTLVSRTGFRADSLGGLYEKVFLAAQLAWLVVASVPVARGRAAPHSRPAAGEEPTARLSD